MKIERKNYTIRPWRISDTENLARYADNIKIWNNVRDAFPHPYTTKDAEAFIGFTNRKLSIEDFAIEVDGHAVGGIGFVPQLDVERFSAEIGYWIGEPFWNRGIVTAVVKDLIDYIWAHTTIIRIFSPVYDFNTASQRVLEKAGFRRVGILEKAALKNGQLCDFHFFELVKPDHA